MMQKTLMIQKTLQKILEKTLMQKILKVIKIEKMVIKK